MLAIPQNKKAQRVVDLRVRMLYAVHLDFLDAVARIGVASNARNAAVAIATEYNGDLVRYALSVLDHAERYVLRQQRQDGLCLPRRMTPIEVSSLQVVRRVAGIK